MSQCPMASGMVSEPERIQKFATSLEQLPVELFLRTRPRCQHRTDTQKCPAGASCLRARAESEKAASRIAGVGLRRGFETK